MSESIIAIVPAAGVGLRACASGEFVTPKQYRPLAGLPMLRHTVLSLLADSRIEQIRVAVSPADEWADAALQGLPRTVWRRCGGPTRAETVAAALADSAAAADVWVLVHDAARPGLPAEALARLIDACLADEVGGLLALPVADTVKCGQDRATRTVDRAGLWLAQTPQMFRAGMLRQALERAEAAADRVTDESSAVQALGHTPRLITGSRRNFKITWPEDFELMEKWL